MPHVKLEYVIEDNRWMARLIGGKYDDKLGDFRLFPKQEFKPGQIFETDEPHMEPTVAHYCGQLIVRVP